MPGNDIGIKQLGVSIERLATAFLNTLCECEESRYASIRAKAGGDRRNSADLRVGGLPRRDARPRRPAEKEQDPSPQA
jgi:hypothetical protein